MKMQERQRGEFNDIRMAYKGFTINELDLLNCIKLNSVC